MITKDVITNDPTESKTKFSIIVCITALLLFRLQRHGVVTTLQQDYFNSQYLPGLYLQTLKKRSHHAVLSFLEFV